MFSGNQSVLVPSGYNIRAVIAFCRWAEAHGVMFHIVARDSHDPIFWTDYKKDVAFVRESQKLSPEILHSWVEPLFDRFSYDRILILPVSEYFNRFLLAHRRAIESNNCIVPLADIRLYEQISDKEKFARLCQTYGLAVPRELGDIPSTPPFVAKPRTYFSASGRQLIPYLIHSEKEFADFLDRENPQEFFFQEFVLGRSIYLLAYLSRSGRDILFSQENLMQQSRGKSIILAQRSNFHQSALAKRYVEMLHDIGFFGLIMIELRFDEANDRYVMIEANPRLWGPMQFIVDNRIGLFSKLLEDCEFEISESAGFQESGNHYFWSGGITEEAQPIAFFNYSADQFVADFPILRPEDIFFRPDTLKLYLKEAAMVTDHAY